MTTASEKLRELDRAMTPFAFVERESGEEAVAIPLANYRYFQRALPQIVAVVEAAEGFFPEHLAVLQSDLPKALAALDEALS